MISATLSFTNRLSKKIKHSIVFGFVTLFIVFVGGGSSVVRAGIMALLAYTARVNGRTTESVSLLFLATAIMSLYEPKMLIYDPGLHLSVLATLGIIILNPSIFYKLNEYIKSSFFAEILSTTLSAQIMVTPYLMWYMGGFSFVGLLSNTIVLPVVPFVMIVGAVFIIASFINQSVAFLISVPLTYLLIFIVKISELSSLGGAGYINISLNTPQTIFIYIMLFIAIFSFQKKKDLDI